MTLISILCLFTLSTAFPRNGLLAGGGGNLSFTTADFSDVQVLDITKAPMPGYNLGLLYEHALVWRLSLLTGGVFDSRGEIHDFSLAGSENVFAGNHYTIQYLQVPVLLQMNFGGPSIFLNLCGGVEFGLLLSANRETNIGNSSVDTDISANIQELDAGYTLGAGTEVELGKAALYLRPSMYFGLVDVLSDELKRQPLEGRNPVNGMEEVTYKHISMRLQAGIKFYL
ncbi:outer membrane beta-barrel protein [Fibrobacterota bacterium]